jgi:hypothetical protein
MLVFDACGTRIFEPNDQVDSTNFSATESFAYEIPAKDQTRFVLDAVNGQVHVVGAPEVTAIRIWGERRVESESEADATAHLDEVGVRITDSRDEIFVQTLQPDNSHGRNYVVTYQVVIPRTWKFFLDHVNGIVTVDSLNNDVSVQLVNGNLQFSAIYGSLHAEVVNGQVTGNLTLPPLGTCKTSTVNGLIALSIPRTTTAEFSAQVTNGNIHVTNLALNNMVSTPHSVQGKLGDGQGTISLSTVNGNISVSGF